MVTGTSRNIAHNVCRKVPGRARLNSREQRANRATYWLASAKARRTPVEPDHFGDGATQLKVGGNSRYLRRFTDPGTHPTLSPKGARQ